MSSIAYHRLALAATLLTLLVVVAGAWVRLTDAGLGCPDWPGCYGRLLAPIDAEAAEAASAAFPHRPAEIGKAWREMIHRYLAGTLGLLIAALAVIALRHRARAGQPVVLPLVLLGLVIFQALLGMWTVTLALQPIVVMAHLLGGLATLALLAWLTLATRPRVEPPPPGPARGLRILAGAALCVLVVQIALGGWVSSNYAALACPDLPTCRGLWWPEADFGEAFVPWRESGSGFEGGVLTGPARTAIHLTHRIGALVAALVLGVLGSVAILRGAKAVRRAGGLILAALALQLTLGLAIVAFGLPLPVAVAHNLGAALLLLAVVALNYQVSRGTWQTV